MSSNKLPKDSSPNEARDSDTEFATPEVSNTETTEQDFMPEEDAQAVEERLRQLGYI